MSSVKFKLNLPGMNALMKSAEMQGILNHAASAIANAAGEGFETETAHPISFVAIASVRAESFEARRRNLQENTLLKAKGSVKI